MARTTLHLAFVIVVLLAGCNGLLDGPDVRTSESAESTTPEPVAYPPGVTDDGVERPLELVSAHQSATSNISYVANRTFVVRFPNGTRFRQVRTVRHGVGDGVYYLRQRTTGEASRARSDEAFRIWTNDTVSVIAVRDGDERVFRRYPETDLIQQFTRTRLLSLFTEIETATTGTTRRGEPLVHLLGTERRENGTRTTGVRNATNWSFSVAVTPEGVVRSYSYSYEGTLNGESVTVTEEFRLKPSGERTVDRPAWVSTAVERTNASSS